jgi:hypothetical protein
MPAPTTEAVSKRQSRLVWVLVTVQLALVAAYSYGVVAYLASDAQSFPEHAPPGWSWPAVVASGVGYCPAAICLALAVMLAVIWPELRADRALWRWLVGASVAAAVMLMVMATPPGWELFDWYVG